eukprot:1462547-Pyramimonas_sp.AAC.1
MPSPLGRTCWPLRALRASSSTSVSCSASRTAEAAASGRPLSWRRTPRRSWTSSTAHDAQDGTSTCT